MGRQSISYFYVQCQNEYGLPDIVYHTHKKDTNEYFYKFIERKKAKALAEAEKKAAPDVKFRVVKCTETYSADEWF